MFRRYLRDEPTVIQEEEAPQLRSYSKKKNEERQTSLSGVRQPLGTSQGVQGVNSQIGVYNLCETGNQTELCKINFSQLPGEKKRLLSVTGASTFLVNYAQDEYPSKISIRAEQASGYLDKTGSSTHVIAILVPNGPAVPVYNSGGVIGYNVAYKLLEQPSPIDISTLPQLTFNVTTGQDQVPAPYPLAQPLTFSVQVTRVIF